MRTKIVCLLSAICMTGAFVVDADAQLFRRGNQGCYSQVFVPRATRSNCCAQATMTSMAPVALPQSVYSSAIPHTPVIGQPVVTQPVFSQYISQPVFSQPTGVQSGCCGTTPIQYGPMIGYSDIGSQPVIIGGLIEGTSVLNDGPIQEDDGGVIEEGCGDTRSICKNACDANCSGGNVAICKSVCDCEYDFCMGTKSLQARVVNGLMVAGDPPCPSSPCN